MNKNSTKKSLKASALSIMLCLAMLIGTTFAWFTDSITNSGNIIQAGNLNIGAVAYDVDAAGDKTVTIPGVNGDKPIKFEAAGADLETSNDPIINDTLWEPGKTNAKLLQVTNKGTLAAKIKLSFDVKNKGLEEYLWFDFVMVDKDGNIQGTFQQRPMNQLSELAKSVEVKLEKDQNVRFVLVYGMDESIGNIAQDKTFSADVAILATQLNSEEDGFGSNKYDENATYSVATNASFEEVMNKAKPGDTITVASGKYNMPRTIAEGVTISGEGKDKTQLIPQATASGAAKTGIILDKKDIKISNAYVRSIYGIDSNEYYGSIDIRDSAILDSLKIEKPKNNSSAIVIKKGFDIDDTITIANSEIYGKHKAIHIVDGANGIVNIVNTEITGVYTINVNSASSQNLVINVKDSKLHGWTSYGDIKFAKFMNTEFSQGTSRYDYIRPYANTTWENCSFDAGLKIGAGATGKTYTFKDCTKNGTKITASNIKTIGLFDMNDDDGVNLKGCTIIVNGTKVTL